MLTRRACAWQSVQPTNDGNGSSLSQGAPTSVWDLHIVMNEATSITCVKLPYFSKEHPISGTKPARVRLLFVFLPDVFSICKPACISHICVRCAQDSLLKLLSGMCNDVCPLNMRYDKEKDNVTPDPYYEVAPGWSTLSGGRRPFIHAPPAEIAAKIKRCASACRLFAACAAVDRPRSADAVPRAYLSGRCASMSRVACRALVVVCVSLDGRPLYVVAGGARSVP